MICMILFECTRQNVIDGFWKLAVLMIPEGERIIFTKILAASKSVHMAMSRHDASILVFLKWTSSSPI